MRAFASLMLLCTAAAAVRGTVYFTDRFDSDPFSADRTDLVPWTAANAEVAAGKWTWT